jgi:hypothetical protein
MARSSAASAASSPPSARSVRPVEPAARVAQHPLGAFGRQGGGGAGHVGAHLLGGLHQAAAGVELGLLPLPWRERGDLGGGVAQELLLAAHFLQPCLGRLQRLPGGCPLRPGRGHGGAQRGEAAEIVQHRPVIARVQKPAVVLLPVQFHQHVRQGPQHLARGAAVVDPGRLAPVGGVHPAQDQLPPPGRPASSSTPWAG